MYKKTLLSLAVASSMTLTGCIQSGDDEVAVDPSVPGAGFNPPGSTSPLFDPAAGALPIPNDLIFDSEQGDGTFGVADTSPPVTTALNELSGASTVAPAVVQFNGSLDQATVKGTVGQDGADVPPEEQTVFLIELAYASGDPVQGLGNRESATIARGLNPTGPKLRYRADVETLSSESGSADAIRILPLEPLDPGKRYIVVVTNEVLTASQEPIIPSFVYSYLTNEENEISGSLDTVQTLINRLWEGSAVGYFGAFVNFGADANPAVPSARADGEGLTADNIAISYSFTTSKDQKVLQYIAEPAAWFSDQITNFLRVSATKKLTGAALFFANQQGADNALPVKDWDLNDDGVVNAADFDRPDSEGNLDGVITPADFLIVDGDSSFGHNELLKAADEAVNGFPTTLPPNPSSPLNALFGSEGPCTIPSKVSPGPAAVDCVAVSLATEFRSELPTPIPGVNRNVANPDNAAEFTNAIDIDDSTIKPVGLVSAVASEIPGAAGVLAAQGSVSLPYYLGNTGTGIAGASAVNWKADSDLAASLNQTFSALGVELPQADPSVSTAVNYIFPFPKQLSTQEVPVLTLYPNSGTIKGVVIYQHGITTDRSAALTFGTGLAGQGFVVVAIDHPLHGVAPFSSGEQLGLAVALLTGGALNDDELEAAVPLVLTANLADLTTLLDNAGVANPGPTAQALIDRVPLMVAGDTEGLVDDGVDAQTAASLVNTVANAGSTIPGLAPVDNERHFGLFSNNGTPAAMVFDPANAAGTNGSGSFFINLQNLLSARDNNRQSVVDKMNLRATLFGNPAAGKSGLTLKRPAEAGGSDGDINVTFTTPVHFAGHSLGTLTGIPFVASVNEDQIAETIFTAADGSTSVPTSFNNIQSASMLTPGGGIVRLLENSPAFAPRILLGLNQAAGLTQGSASLEAFFNVAQASVDASDPVNFAAMLHAKTPVLISEVAGETVIPNAADQIQWGIPALDGTFTPEQTDLPVSVTVNSFPAPLSGTRPLSLGLGQDGGYLVDFETGSEFFTSYPAGSHGTPVSGSPDTVFGGMLCETFVTFGVGLSELPLFCSAPQ